MVCNDLFFIWLPKIQILGLILNDLIFPCTYKKETKIKDKLFINKTMSRAWIIELVKFLIEARERTSRMELWWPTPSFGSNWNRGSNWIQIVWNVCFIHNWKIIHLWRPHWQRKPNSKYIQLNKYETAPNFIQLTQNLTSDCLLI